MMQANSPSRRI